MYRGLKLQSSGFGTAYKNHLGACQIPPILQAPLNTQEMGISGGGTQTLVFS